MSKPSIKELEKILNEKGNTSIITLPDGEIRAMDHDLNEALAHIWFKCGGTAKSFNESWQFIEHMIAEKEKVIPQQEKP